MWFSSLSVSGGVIYARRASNLRDAAGTAKWGRARVTQRAGCVLSSGEHFLVRLLRSQLAERALVFGREHLHELTARRIPVLEQRFGTRRTGELKVPLDESLEQRFVRRRAMPQALVDRAFLFGLLQNRFQRDHRLVALARERSLRIEHISDAARHAGREVAARFAKHDHGAARHVFATVVARAFDNRRRARVTHAEPLARNAAE